MSSVEQTAGGRRLRSLIFGSALGPFLGLLMVFGLFAAGDAVRSRMIGKRTSFATVTTCQQLLRNSSLTAAAALGMLIVIISGGIDLSVGTGLALCAAVIGALLKEGWGIEAAIAGGLAAGCLIGFVNGALITSLRLAPFIVTLGTMSILRGLGQFVAQSVSSSTRVNAAAQTPNWVLELQQMTPEPRWLLVATGVWLTLLLAAAVGVTIRYSVFGRRVFAIGSNESTARLCGVNVARTRIAVYTVAGFFTGVAGLFFFSMSGADVSSEEGVGKELTIIAAVVIGGGSLNGGRGSLLGTLAGACIIETIAYGCTTLGIGTTYQHMIVGGIIIAAVVLDQVRQRRMRE